MSADNSAQEVAQRATPAAELPRAVVELSALRCSGVASCIATLPYGNRVATGSDDGKVRIYSAATGLLEREFEGHVQQRRQDLEPGPRGRKRSLRGFSLSRSLYARDAVKALCALGGDVIASSGQHDQKVVTWDAAIGKRLCNATVGASSKDNVWALVSMGNGRFAVGTCGGGLVLFAHSGGRDVRETTRIAHAHAFAICGMAACEGHVATASSDRTAAVWDVAWLERLATLRGHRKTVQSVDMSDLLVVTGSEDHTVRVYSRADGYNCVAVLDWLHSNKVSFVKVIGNDIVASAGWDAIVCVTRVSTRTDVARVKVDRIVRCAAVLADGRLAVGCDGYAACIAPPEAAVDALKAHGAAMFPVSAGMAHALAVAKSLPPLQDSVVRVIAGDLSAAVACRELVSERACSGSLAEWYAAHVLLMRAVQDGDIPAKTEYEGKENWWFRCLYAQAPKPVVGEKSCTGVLKCVRDACAAGVLETAEGAVDAVIVRHDLEEVGTVCWVAEKQIMITVGQLFLRQIEADRRLTQHLTKFRRFRDVQRVTKLVGAVFSLVPFADAAVTECAELAEGSLGGVKASNVIESLVGIGVRSQALVSGPFTERFMRGMRDVLDKDIYSAMPEKNRQMLDTAIESIGMTVDGLRALAVHVIGDGAHVVEISDAANASEFCELEKVAADARRRDEGGHGGGANRAPSNCAVAPERAQVGKADNLYVMGCSVATADRFDVGDGRKVNSDGQSEQVQKAHVAGELERLEKDGLGAESVSRMKTEQLASALAAFLVGYDTALGEQFLEIRKCLTKKFRKERMFGRSVVGKYAIQQEVLYNMTMDALSCHEPKVGCETDGPSVRAFLQKAGEA